jgi:MFS family permease
MIASNKSTNLKRRLQRNFKLMFWVQAFVEIKVINVISTLFYLYRGLTLTQVFYTAITFSIVSLLSEVPSSYLADKWGRKKVIILSILASLIYWIVNIFAWSFPVFIFAISLLAFAHALMSGTDEALIYDTSKQLDNEGPDDKNQSLRRLGNYYSASRIFKIFVPLLAVIIAHNLNNAQYILVLGIDIIATLLALVLSVFLTEPRHSIKVEKIEAGVLKDAVKLFRRNTNLLRIMFNKSLIFIAVFILWRVSSQYFTSKDVPLLFIGIATSAFQLIGYCVIRNITKFLPHIKIEARINTINLFIATLLIFFFVLNLAQASMLMVLGVYVLILASEVIKGPIYSEIINKASSSYNRATTISLANFLKSILDVPLLFLSAYLVSLGYIYLFALVVVIAIVSTVFFPLKNNADPIS